MMQRKSASSAFANVHQHDINHWMQRENVLIKIDKRFNLLKSKQGVESKAEDSIIAG